MRLDEVQIRDPFVLPLARERVYFLYGTTDKSPWNGPFEGFDFYCSRDLEQWDGPFPAFRPPADFWGQTHFWAPEVWEYQGRFWMLATFAPGNAGFRGTQTFVADSARGAYVSWSQGAITPHHWMCLDGTLHIDSEGAPWLVFCQEWLQIHDGAMWAQRNGVQVSVDFLPLFA